MPKLYYAGQIFELAPTQPGETMLDRLVRAHLVDAIEVFNGRMVVPMDNWAAKKYAATHQIAMTVGSDAHGTWEYGGSYIAIAPFTDAASFLKHLPGAILHGHRSAQWVHLISSFAKKQRKRRPPSPDEAADALPEAQIIAAGKGHAR